MFVKCTAISGDGRNAGIVYKCHGIQAAAQRFFEKSGLTVDNVLDIRIIKEYDGMYYLDLFDPEVNFKTYRKPIPIIEKTIADVEKELGMVSGSLRIKKEL